jgi:hypothetical protein
MAAILDSLGFTFLIDRMTEVLTPDIYIELTEPNMAEIEGILARHSQSPYVRGQLNFYIFLYFPSKNLIKTDVI